MKRQVIIGGAIAVISVASAAAFGIVQSGWWSPAPQRAAQAELATTAAAAAPKPTTVAAAPTPRSPQASPVQTLPTQPPATPTPAPQTPAAQIPAAQPAQSPPTQTAAQAPAAPASPPPVVLAQAPAPAPAPVAKPPAAPPAAAAAAAPQPAYLQPKPVACANPNAMGLARTVEIDTTGGPGFGSQHFKTYDFLRDHEVVLTFDDGPWLNNTPAVLKALADQCIRATFFSIGKHATYYPEILHQVVAAGHTVGSHTWSHADLQAAMKKGPEAAKE